MARRATARAANYASAKTACLMLLATRLCATPPGLMPGFFACRHQLIHRSVFTFAERLLMPDE
jgi:hypothetical protein